MLSIDEMRSSTPPPAAGLLRDFVNTVEWQVDEESWQTPADLESWYSDRAGVLARGLTDADLALARRVREGIRSLLLIHAGHDPLASDVDSLNEALGMLPLRLTVEPGGSVTLTGSGSPTAQPLGVILAALDSARNDGTWARLKACSRDSCRWAYWDGSRNASGRWCSMPGCGNYIKMRRRNGAAAADQDAIADADGSARVPTMLDVAARAGVSIKTVSNVVTGLHPVADTTRDRVEVAIEELGYRPNLVARALRTGHPIDVE